MHVLVREKSEEVKEARTCTCVVREKSEEVSEARTCMHMPPCRWTNWNLKGHYC